MLKLSEKQQEIVDSDARIKLIMGGMRSGKTTVLLNSMLREMKKRESKNTRVIIYETEQRFLKLMVREIKARFRDIIFLHNISDSVFETTYGSIQIIIAEEGFKPWLYVPDIIVMDTASRNQYFLDIYEFSINSLSQTLNTDFIQPSILISGHCPEDENNAFYKAWCSAYYNDIPDTKAFKLKTYDNPAISPRKEEWEKQIMPSMTLERYIRDYYATII